MSNLLRNSLYSSYRDSPDILDLFDQLDFSKLSYAFDQELYLRITKDEKELVEEMIASELVKKYEDAVLAATLAVTRPLYELLELVLVQNESGRLN